MSASSGWDGNQWPAPDPADRVVDHTGEPVGYDLEAVQVYEQPPQPRQPWRVPAARPVSARRVVVGCGLGLAGLVSAPFLSPTSLMISVAAALMSSAALIRSRRVGMPLRGVAVAGLVLGVLGCLLAILLAVDFSTGSAVEGPG